MPESSPLFRVPAPALNAPNSTAYQEGASILATAQNLARELLEEISEQEQPNPSTQEMLLGMGMRLLPGVANLFQTKKNQLKRSASKKDDNKGDDPEEAETPGH